MNRTTLYLTLASLFAVGACETNKNTLTSTPQGLESSRALQPTDTSGLEGADYSFVDRALKLNDYTSLLFEPVTVYRGDGAHFENMSPGEVQTYAGILNGAFETALRQAHMRATAPGPHVARLKVTLIGVTSTTGGVATLTRVVPVGALSNVVRMEEGKGGSLTGGIQYSVEAFDSQTGRLLAAAIRRAAPDVFDMNATLSTEDTVRSASKEAAERLLATMERNIRSRR